jgi:hypothetical protein
MFLLGHIGIGRAMARPWRTRLPVMPLILGTLLPDIIDKPLYYSRAFDLITCTRTFGHTGLLILLIAGAAWLRRSRALAAVSLGMATHLILDCIVDLPGVGRDSATWVAMLWPLLGHEFVTSYFQSMKEHFLRLGSWPVLSGEVVGGVLLLIEWRQRKAGARPVAAERSGIRSPGSVVRESAPMIADE